MINFEDQRNDLEEKSMKAKLRFSMHRNDVAHVMMMIITIDVAKASVSGKNQE